MHTIYRCSVVIFVMLVLIGFNGVSTKNCHKSKDYRLQKHFKNFLTQYDKSYLQNITEYNRRFVIFKESLKKIETLNQWRQHRDTIVYGLTPFSDMTELEFQALVLANVKHLSENAIQKAPSPDVSQEWPEKFNQKLPLQPFTLTKSGSMIAQQIDWRDKGIITPVNYQGTCGACWAISVIETIESMKALHTNTTIVEMSVQQMIDCAQNTNMGCGGGDTCKLLEWLTVNRIGIANRQQYPDRSEANPSQHICQNLQLPNELLVHVKSYSCEYLAHHEDRLLWYLNSGPLTVALNAFNWQFYIGGVIQFNCDSAITNQNHAVQIVGYDLTAEIPYYIVRNSWGLHFGNSGYMKIAIGKNVCGIANQVSRILVE